MVNKVEQIAEVRSTPHRQKILKIFNYLGEMFNKPTGEESASPGCLKILTLKQMLSRLPIFLAQLKAGIILKNLKTKLGNYCILCADKKNSQNNSIKVWLTLFKNGNNLYEH